MNYGLVGFNYRNNLEKPNLPPLLGILILLIDIEVELLLN
jgi:hypothetical protein